MRQFLLLLLLWPALLWAQPPERPYVVLVSFDGFRHDYVSLYNLPNFKQFITKGVAAAGLIPSYPSKTFPNHYTLVTGLYPGNHGLVDNIFYDRERKTKYTPSDRTLVEDSYYYGGTPLWQLAQAQGVKTASCFWVGSEAPVAGSFPTYYFRYDHNAENKNRIDQVIAWLNLPPADRPHFISLYFSLVDTQGHETGPLSPELNATVIKADSLLGYLMTALKKINLPVNVVLVSDHGMMQLEKTEKAFITLSSLFNTSDTTLVVINSATHAQVYTDKPDSLFRILKPQEKFFKVYKKETIPTHWHYQHDRVGDLILVADAGYQFQLVSRKFGNLSSREFFGNHGFDPYSVQDMHGIFYAAGPNITKGKKIKAFENIHVFPFLAELLQLKYTEIDGKPEVLRPLIKK